MLNDLKYIHQRDSGDMLGRLAKPAAALPQAYVLNGPPLRGNFEQIICVGAGSSAVAAQLVQRSPATTVPMEIVWDYGVPPYTSAKTLCVLMSYSGDSEEALGALAAALDKGAQVAVITSGGRLLEVSQQMRHAYIELPATEFHQTTVFAMYGALIQLLSQARLLQAAPGQLNLSMIGDSVNRAVATWAPTVPISSNLAKQLALDSIGKSVIVYSGPRLWPAACSWKLSLNQNAKQLAWAIQYPGCSQAELNGWAAQPVNKPYAIIELHSQLEHNRTQRQMAVTTRLLSGKRPALMVINVAGNTLLEQWAWSIMLGSFVSIYMALASGNDPSDHRLNEKFKQYMEEL